MPTETTETTQQTPAAKTEGTTPAATTQTPPAAPPVVAKTEVTPQADPPAKKEPTRATLAGDEDDLPNVDFLEMPKKAFEKRLKKASQAELNRTYEKYGVKDGDELAAMIKEARDNRAAQEEARKAQLSKEERLEEERTAILAERDEWKTKYERRVQLEEIKEQSSALGKMAAEFIDPEFVEDELPKLAKYLTAKFTDEELKHLSDDVVRDYWKDLAAKRPKIALTKTEAAKPPQEKQPLRTGAVDKNPPAAKSDDQKPKSFAPKKDANGRTIETPEEARAAREAMRAQGLAI
jgi:hypothetical protein